MNNNFSWLATTIKVKVSSDDLTCRTIGLSIMIHPLQGQLPVVLQYWLYILMNLTNQDLISADQSFSMNAYTLQTNPLSNELSCNSETQLLDPSAIQQNSSFCISSQESFRKPFLLRVDENNSQFYDLSDEFEIANRSIDYLRTKQNGRLNGHLQDICKELVIVTSNLQKKLQLFEQGGEKTQHRRTQSSILFEDDSHKRKIDSFSKLTSSTGLKESVQRLCSLEKDQVMEVLLDLIEAKGQIKIYKEQHQNMQAELVRLKVLNEEQTNQLRRKATQVVKLRELLRQYQIYHKNRTLKENKNQCNTLKNSLDKRMKYDPNQHIGYLRKEAEYFHIRQTPKTPNNIGYHNYKKSANFQKTKARQSSSAQHNFIKQLIEFSSKTQQNRQRDIFSTSKLSKSRRSREDKSSCSFYEKYPFNQLLEMEVTLKHCTQGDECKQDHISTMESLPELSESNERKGLYAQASSYCFKKYIPSDSF